MTPAHGGGRLYLVRHAKAQARERWAGPDGSRPLTPKGERQAEAIASDLATARRSPREVLSSPAIRCVQTVTPLAQRLGIRIEELSWLEEGADAASALKLLSERVADGSRLAACTHGDIIWGVLDDLARAGVDLGPRPDAPKGGVWRFDYAKSAPTGGAATGGAGAGGATRSGGPAMQIVRAKLLLPGGGELHGTGDD